MLRGQAREDAKKLARLAIPACGTFQKKSNSQQIVALVFNRRVFAIVTESRLRQ
jgi:hypothetical protein